MMAEYLFEHALLESGWANDVLISTGSDGRISTIKTGVDRAQFPSAERVKGYAIPGMANAHSHAFQYAMAGMAEYAGNPKDSFWTWRELMYKFAERLTPDHMQAIAAQLYISMLKSGYTGVGEFHYVHHDALGAAYGDVAEMSSSIFSAANDAGIYVRHLPVLYQRGGFDGRPLNKRQARFGNDLDQYMAIYDRAGKMGDVGVCFHSLRAVDAQHIAPVLKQVVDDTPIHIHIAEQPAEVEDCIAHTGMRPVEYLHSVVELDRRWNLVHATHMSDTECVTAAASGAVAVICPTTEANLGDGIFSLSDWATAGGNIAIGSDSHISVDPFEELRLLEYGQRLKMGQRTVYAAPDRPHVGHNLWQDAAKGGASSIGRDSGMIKSGRFADITVLSGDKYPALKLAAPKARLDAAIFAVGQGCVRDVMVGGVWQVKDGHHPKEDEILSHFEKTCQILLRD